MIRTFVTLLATSVVALASPAIAAEGGKKGGEGGGKDAGEKEEPGFEHYVHPLLAQGPDVISPAVGAVPRTQLHVGLGVLWGKREHGRTTQRLLDGNLLIGGEWSPSLLPRLGLGAEMVLLRTTHLGTELPPAIDEWNHLADLGILRLHVRFVAWQARISILEMAVTPFFRFGLPTDTSRTKDDRHMPVREVIDPKVSRSPWMLADLGLAFGMTVSILSVSMHQSAVFAPVPGETLWYVHPGREGDRHPREFHFYWSMHFGVAVDILNMFEISVEFDGLMRTTRDYTQWGDVSLHSPFLSAWAISPGLRFQKGKLAYEISVRIGLTPDAYAVYGDFTAAFSVIWMPGRAR